MTNMNKDGFHAVLSGATIRKRFALKFLVGQTVMIFYEKLSRNTLAVKSLFDKLDEPFDQAQIEAVLSIRLRH
jgi:hypothetical protein